MHSDISRNLKNIYIKKKGNQVHLDMNKWYIVLGSCRISFTSRVLVLSSPVSSSYSSPKKGRVLLAEDGHRNLAIFTSKKICVSLIEETDRMG